mmetsp:Transcript_53545/g.114823  ORF Transcript_53545/g.114823 Transcript_53545/m.114823 type:complete len:207 (+) Transcript_53545:71-691(+)
MSRALRQAKTVRVSRWDLPLASSTLRSKKFPCRCCSNSRNMCSDCRHHGALRVAINNTMCTRVSCGTAANSLLPSSWVSSSQSAQADANRYSWKVRWANRYRRIFPSTNEEMVGKIVARTDSLIRFQTDVILVCMSRSKSITSAWLKSFTFFMCVTMPIRFSISKSSRRLTSTIADISSAARSTPAFSLCSNTVSTLPIMICKAFL